MGRTTELNRHWSHRIREVMTFVAVIWAVYLIGLVVPATVQWGLVPRTGSGLVGIVTMPFLHAGLGHLLSNTIPLVILMILLASSRRRCWSIVAGMVLASGILLWLLGRTANHIGASGLVFGLIAFLVTAGLLEKRVLSLLLTCVVLFLFSGTFFWGLVPVGNRSISVEGHLFGAAAGVLLAFVDNSRDRRTVNKQLPRLRRSR